MDTTKCIDNAVWAAYAAHSLAALELERLHDHALSCDVCADIKAGIDAMADSSLLASKVVDIQREVDVFLSANSFGLNQGVASVLGENEGANSFGLNQGVASV
ncbi:MAG: hypothetical protein SGJ00_06495, partial [bacterium]|nr:hypothetical protein [bacterium]